MALSINQLKKAKLPINATDSNWLSLIPCAITASLFDILSSYIALQGFNIITDNTLSGLGTIDLPLKLAQQGASTGQTLIWNGTTWTPGSSGSTQTLSLVGSTLSISGGNSVDLAALSGVDTLDELTDVSISGPTTNQILRYNGSLWVNVTPTYTSLGSGLTGDIAYYDGTNWVALTPVKNVQVGISGNVVILPSVPAASTIMDVYLNGHLLTESTDYTHSGGGNLLFAPTLIPSDIITTKYYT